MTQNPLRERPESCRACRAAAVSNLLKNKLNSSYGSYGSYFHPHTITYNTRWVIKSCWKTCRTCRTCRNPEISTSFGRQHAAMYLRQGERGPPPTALKAIGTLVEGEFL